MKAKSVFNKSRPRTTRDRHKLFWLIGFLQFGCGLNATKEAESSSNKEFWRSPLIE